MDKPRRHRRRKGGTKKRWNRTPQVMAILRHLAHVRYARKKFLDAYFKRHNKGMADTLARMVDTGIIEKPEAQWDGMYTLSQSDIYGLTDYGKDVLEEEYPDIKFADDYFKGGDSFRHDIATSDTVHSLMLGLGDLYVGWEQFAEGKDPFRWQYKTTHKGDTYEGSIRPDWIWGVRLPKGVAACILETERKGKQLRTDPKQSSRLKKCVVYDHLDDIQAIQNRLGVKLFRVFITLPTKAMVANTLEMIEANLHDTDLIAVRTIPMQRYDKPNEPEPFPHIATDPWESTAGHVFVAKW